MHGRAPSRKMPLDARACPCFDSALLPPHFASGFCDYSSMMISSASVNRAAAPFGKGSSVVVVRRSAGGL